MTKKIHDVQPMKSWLDRYPPGEEDRKQKSDELKKKEESLQRKALLAMEPQATLDLHGLIVAEAKESTDAFLRACRSRGLRKVMIIHGKGNHSQGKGVLKKEISDFIKRHPLAEAHGTAERRMGGSGAMWVVLKKLTAP